MKERFILAFESMQQTIIEKSPSIVIGLIFLAIFVLLGISLRNLIRRRLLKNVEDRLLVNFSGRVVFLTMLIIGIVIFLNQVGLGKAAGGLLAGAGVSAIIIGFAFKDIGENFLAGFFLAFSRPFGIGDVIEVESIKGMVKALSFRNTHLRTFDGRDIFVPNAMLIKFPLQNYTRDGLLRYDFVVGLDYGDNMNNAIKHIYDALSTNDLIEHSGELAPFIQMENFGTSTINLGIYYWVDSKNFTGHIANLKTNVMTQVLSSLVDKGFTLPADIVELKIYQEEHPIPIKLNQN